jgi:hypothetical protein
MGGGGVYAASGGAGATSASAVKMISPKDARMGPPIAFGGDFSS